MFKLHLTAITVDNNEHETSTIKGFKQKTLLQFKWNVINSFWHKRCGHLSSHSLPNTRYLLQS